MKIDVDRNPEIASQLRIQSIPAVYAFSGGRPVDGFVGALPESQVKTFVQRLLAGAAPEAGIEEALAEAKSLLEAGDATSALEVYQSVMAEDPANAVATAGTLRALIALKREPEARTLLEQIPADVAKHADIVAVRTSNKLSCLTIRSRPSTIRSSEGFCVGHGFSHAIRSPNNLGFSPWGNDAIAR